MAKSYIKEIGDRNSHGVSADTGARVKTIAPVYYRPADNSADSSVVTIQSELDKRLVATSGTKALSWGSATTIGTVGGTDLKISLPANPDTDTKVTQTVDTSNDAAYPLLAKNTTATATITDTSRFTSGVTLNPKNKSITATTFIGALSGNATTATHGAAHAYVRLWASGQYSASTPYALLAEKTVSTTVNWGFGQLFKLEVNATYVIFKINLRGGKTFISANSDIVPIIYSYGLSSAEVNKAVVVTYSYTANATCVVRIYSDLRLTTGDWQRVSLRQLDNQAGDLCSYNDWDTFTFYKRTDNTGNVASVTGTPMTNNFSSANFFGTATSATKATQDSDGKQINSTYLKLSGGTMTGKITAQPGQYTDDNVSCAINMNNSNIIGLNSIYTADASDGASEGIHFYRDATHVDTLWMAGGALYFVPNRALGTSTSAADSQKVARLPASITDNQVVFTNGTAGALKTNTLDAACNLFINALSTGSSTPTDNDYYVAQYAGGGTTTTSYHRRPVSALWTYIKGKMTSDSAVNISGNAATASAAQSGSALETAINGKVSKSGDTMTGALTSTKAQKNAILASHGTANTEATIGASRTDTGVTVWLGVGSGGANHGIYSDKNNNWIIRADTAGNVAINDGKATNTVKIGTSTLGSSTQPVWVDGGVIKTCTAYSSATVGTATNSTNSAVTADTTHQLYLIGATGSSGQQALKTDTGIYATATAGQLHATTFDVNSKCTLQFNATTNALDFVFA